MSGKSTLFRIIASITRPSKGSVTVDGMKAGLDTRKIVAFLPDVNPFYGWMKVMEQFEFLSAFSWPSRLVLMDEPLGGIDPPARKKIINTFFSEFRFGEQTIIMSTHIVNEVEEFLEDVIYLKEGKIVLSGEADRLREEKGTSLVGIFEEIAG